MDETVLRAIAKWPNVPAVYGWLSLDRRGQWLIKGERIANPLVTGFIGRNYGSDLEGRWFFQNGPQRVYVRLECTPQVFFVQRMEGDPAIVTHTGAVATQVREAVVDESGALVLRTDVGVGVVCDRDLSAASEMLLTESGQAVDDDVLASLLAGAGEAQVQLQFGARRIAVQAIASSELRHKFAFNPDPRPTPGEPDC
jgi:hypothetical protein